MVEGQGVDRIFRCIHFHGFCKVSGDRHPPHHITVNPNPSLAVSAAPAHRATATLPRVLEGGGGRPGPRVARQTYPAVIAGHSDAPPPRGTGLVGVLGPPGDPLAYPAARVGELAASLPGGS